MTVIVALKDEENKKIYLGADRQGTSGDVSFNDFGCKLLKVEIPKSDNTIDSMYVAFSGSSFLHSYILNVFQAPIFNVDNNFIEYLSKDFFKYLRTELLNDNMISITDNVCDSESGLIIVHDSEIYDVYSEFSIVESPREYAVNGRGYKFALSVIENNLFFHKDMDYKQIVEEALYTTGKLSIYCNTDYDILTIDY